MISFNNLGNMGRLGNQMFQYAALLGISYNRNFDYCIPDSKISLYECFKIPKRFSNTNFQSISSKSYEFDDTLFQTCPDNVDLYGYFQSEKYFIHIENIIRQHFTFNDIIRKMCLNYKNNLFYDSEIISLHIRRTDYLTDPNFDVLPLDYYYDALKKLPSLPVIIISDDPEWCSENFKDSKFTISKSKNQFIDMCLMSLCDYHIIANSSFSWWGSWLSKSKQTIAPKTWFFGEFSTWNTKDLYLNNWILL